MKILRSLGNIQPHQTETQTDISRLFRLIFVSYKRVVCADTVQMSAINFMRTDKFWQHADNWLASRLRSPLSSPTDTRLSRA